MPGKHRRPTSRVRRATAATVGVLVMGSALFVSLAVIDQFAGRSLPDDAAAAAARSGELGNAAAPSFVPSPLAIAAPGVAPIADVPAVAVASNSPTPTSTTAAVPSRSDVASASVLRLQQLLADLKYLPVTFTPTVNEDTPVNQDTTVAAQLAMMSAPPDGTFAMRFSSTPQPLADLWVPGALTPVTIGAIMAFRNLHKMVPDATTDQAFWTALLSDAASGQVDPAPYSWAWTTMTRPETLQVWVDGAFVLSTAANTGIAAAPTPRGSWPVYARYRTQTMSGTNPNGSHYRDPGVPYVNYFHGGDAVHGFLRGSYGRPQSLGCVELSYSAASQVWKLIDYGTVVTVSL
jgi:L,D-transpeptidase catalytic domain